MKSKPHCTHLYGCRSVWLFHHWSHCSVH